MNGNKSGILSVIKIWDISIFKLTINMHVGKHLRRKPFI
jgi:hypothetical protein